MNDVYHDEVMFYETVPKKSPNRLTLRKISCFWHNEELSRSVLFEKLIIIENFVKDLAK